jgi:phospholipid/cholesterol/gamma-HCH transport system permease protein
MPKSEASYSPLKLRVNSFFDAVGDLTLNLSDSLRFVTKGRFDIGQTLVQTAVVGFDSLPMSILICVIAGGVLALQTAERFAQSGAENYVGGLVALAVIRELGPIFTCLAVGARAGTAIAAEIANMQVTEQIDALKSMHINPLRYLMAPRLLACIISLPLLTIVGEIAAVLGGMFVARSVVNLHYSKYLDSVWLFVKFSDIEVSLIKAVIFGLILATISCTIGLNTRGGARDVGLSTTKAVVWVSTTIIIADFFLTWIFFGPSGNLK